MAKKTLIIDDMTGDTGAHTHALRFEGVEYEIDLTDASFTELRTLLKPYLRAARATSGAPPSTAGLRRPRAPKAPAGDSAAIRRWARAAGVAVTDRGRVAPAVREAWTAAGSPR